MNDLYKTHEFLNKHIFNEVVLVLGNKKIKYIIYRCRCGCHAYTFGNDQEHGHVFSKMVLQSFINRVISLMNISDANRFTDFINKINPETIQDTNLNAHLDMTKRTATKFEIANGMNTLKNILKLHLL